MLFEDRVDAELDGLALKDGLVDPAEDVVEDDVVHEEGNAGGGWMGSFCAVG